ncbi:SnodProt1 [Lactarius psammicola]|nr:SnodProt1 [Lactarius psammicola]
MKLTFTLVSLAALFSVASADTVRYNTFYDNASTSMNNVACSDGDNGLVTKFPTFGLEFSTMRIVLGVNVLVVTRSTSPAIDTLFDGFSISLGAMNTLTNGKAQELDVVDAQATQVDKWRCGL